MYSCPPLLIIVPLAIPPELICADPPSLMIVPIAMPPELTTSLSWLKKGRWNVCPMLGKCWPLMTVPLAVAPELMVRELSESITNPETETPDSKVRLKLAPLWTVFPLTTYSPLVSVTLEPELKSISNEPPLLTIEPLAMPPDPMYSYPPLLTTVPLAMPPDPMYSYPPLLTTVPLAMPPELISR